MTDSSRRAFRVAYDGTAYRGFQRQPHGDTVEDALLDALAALGVTGDERVPEGYAAAGRTDAGVSALAQTVAFDAPEWLTPSAFNGELPDGVRAWAHADAAPGFHATHDARSRTYEYHLHAPTDAVADARAERACETLSGSHDVHNLTPDDAGTEREVAVACERDGAFLVLTFAAGGFPRQFVRRAVSLVESVARGEREAAFLDRVLSGEELSGPGGVAPAAPEPLVLVDVEYGLDFTVDEDAAVAARATFEARRVEREASARVAGRLADVG